MNFLGHAMLSTSNAGNIAGNVAGDFFHGAISQINTSADIKTGVLQHRTIDSYTDSNIHVLDANKIFHPDYGKYAPVITDILWDYYIAHDSEIFYNQQELSTFANHIYSNINTQITSLPLQFQQIFPNMQSNDWLSGYYFKERIIRALNHLSQRAKYWPKEVLLIEEIWQKNDDFLLEKYLLLKSDLIKNGILNNLKK